MSNLPVNAYLAQFPLFAELNLVEADQISSSATLVRVPKGAYVYLADEPSNFVCLLLKGSVKIGVYAPDGRELIKSIQHPFDLFGEMSLVGEANRIDFACATSSDVLVLQVPTKVFQSVMQHSFSLTQKVMSHLGRRLRRAERQCESLVLKDVRSRIVDFLKENAGARGRQVGFEMLIKHGLTQQDIANIVGASRQTVAAIMNELRKSNLIHFNRHSILIRDLDKLD